MGIMVYSLLRVMQDLYHEQYYPLGFLILAKVEHTPVTCAS